MKLGNQDAFHVDFGQMADGAHLESMYERCPNLAD